MGIGSISSTKVSQQLNHGSTIEVEENSTTLVNLPPLCLDHILKHLDLTDLTNAANSHSALTASAIRVFDVYFKHKPIVLYHTYISYDFLYSFQKHWRWRKELRPTIQFVQNKRLFSSILNHFGPKMESLDIHIEHRFILDKVIEKCAPNLTILHVSFAQNDLHLNDHFPKLHELVFIIVKCNIPNSWSKINEHFPELRCLEIHSSMPLGCQFEFEKTFIDHIPNLTRFAKRHFLSEEFGRLANKHLNSLRLADSGGIYGIIKSIDFEELEITDLDVSSDEPMDCIRPIEQLRQLRTLRVGGVLTFENLDLNQLEELDISAVPCHAKYRLAEFFTSCKNLKKLTVRYDGWAYEIESTDFEQMTDTLPELEKFTIKISRARRITEIFTQISTLMRQHRNLHSIDVIAENLWSLKRHVWSQIQHENWELSARTFTNARFRNKKIRNA